MKKKLCIVALGAAAVLAGCGTDVPDLSRVDNNVAAQYVADALLRNDKHYDESLDYDHSLLEPTPTPEPTQAPTSEPAGSSAPGNTEGAQGASAPEEGQSVTNVSLSEIYGVPGVTVEQTSYEVKNSYGSQAFSVITPKKGKKLAVVYFKVSNGTGKAMTVNLEKAGVKPWLYLNGESAGGPLLSIADGDLQSFKTKIGAGRKKQGVLLFEVDKSAKINQLEVRFEKGNSQASVAVR